MNVLLETMTCPITQQVMKNPVIGSDGNTYEREAITQWLFQKSTSPLTNEVMYVSSLKVNPAIQHLVDQYFAGNLSNFANRESKKDSTSDNSKSNNKIPKIQYIPNIESSVYQSSDNIVISLFDNAEKSSDFNSLGFDVVLCLDRSGSTQLGVELKDSDNNNIETGFSINDIIRHSAKTVASILNENDRIACIAFDDKIETVFPLMSTTNMNKSTILRKIDDIKPRNQTNIYGSITEAINMLNGREDKSRNTAIIMLTDGQPNISPARGEVETLKILKTKSGFSVPIYTFGFGYSLQKNLLYDLAKIANATTSHIPDAGMIATVFCSVISTIKCTIAQNTKIIIDNKDSKIKKVLGDFPCVTNKSNEIVIDVGSVQYQQSRNILLQTNGKIDKLNYYYSYKCAGELYILEPMHYSADNFANNQNIISQEYIRCYTVEKLREIVYCKENGTDYNKPFQELLEVIRSESVQNLELVKNIRETIEDQVEKCVSNPQWFEKWGYFYIDQLSSSLLHEKRANFKDKACFTFGGPKYNEILDLASDTFDNLEPVKPSLIRHRYSGNSYSQPSFNMSAMNNCSGGCFSGDSLVEIGNSEFKQVKEFKQIKDLKPGDTIVTYSDHKCPNDSNKTITKIKNVVCMYSKEGYSVNHLSNNHKITDWHPVFIEGKWQFPAELDNKFSKSKSEYVYTLILESGHIVNIDEIPTICLGHNFEEGILKHEFFGTDKVIEEYKKYENEEGIININ